MQVLIVEDEAEAAETLSRGLRRHGHQTVDVSTGARALEAYRDADLILLDLELPDIDGLEVCRTIRAACATPIIAFTDRATELDRILGLQAGSDDCMGKPYVFHELMARIDAVMRRVRPQHRAERRKAVSDGPLRIDPATRQVFVADEQVELTRKEFDLLYHLASHPGVVISRQELMVEIWGDTGRHALSSRAGRTIDTHVSTLRTKLGASSWIVTVRGVGFRFGRG
ncbi:response regulator transcription factor [Streptomyces sp. GMR22]|uniref:response regulator transcription factor n=1 Tax=Streptomyces sp. GMR22 TaxID=2759524 RepID=UPI0015F858C9|nr:response regulator transcription factor [Streptomyces sp. GMR22]MBA6437045.1 response regulator transcription factor [Streptomyces sp. GMR22]